MSRARFLLPVLLALGLPPGAWADDTPPPAATPPVEAAAADAAGDIGRSIFVANEVNGQAGETPPKQIAVNDDILFNEDITTGADAKTVIEFRDGSTFEVGPDAVVRIDSFVFNPEESTSQKTLQVTRGVFRYVSGYVAGNQEAKIASPTGALAIRGSVAEGIVDPDVPNFVYVGEGNATFTNSAGTATLQPGNAIAVPSASTPPMAAAAMPAPVAAQALAVIEKRLPPREALRNRPAADDAWLKRQGAADLVPVAAQAQHQAPVRPMPNPAARGSLAGELGLLAEGNKIGLFHGGGGARTPEQTAFLARAARENPGAALTLRRYQSEARILHTENRVAGTRMVIGTVGRAAPSAEIMHKVTEASIRANPGAAAQIRRHATESYRGAETGHRGAASHPGERGPSERRNAEPAHERRVQPEQHERQPKPGAQQQQRQKPGAVKQQPPKPQPKQPEKKAPPKKGEKDKEPQR